MSSYKKRIHPPKPCDECGKIFTPFNNTNRFCCHSCSKDWWHKKRGLATKEERKFICKACGNEFVRYTGYQVYCSEKCRRKRRETLCLEKPIVREYFLEKANFKCQECGTENNNNNLHLHHIFPLYKGGDDEEDNIIVLCKTCHFNKHKIR